MIDFTEYTHSVQPFVVRRTVRWGECDPAGIVNTGRFSDYVLGAVRMFKRQVERDCAPVPVPGEGLGLPCKAMSFVFHAPLRPDDVIDIEVRAGEIRSSTVDFLLKARLPDGRLAFESVFTQICIRREDRVRVPVPEAMRASLARYTGA